MPRIVAIDFDAQTGQVVVVERRPTGTTVRHARHFQLEGDTSSYSAEQLAEQVHRELANQKISGAKAVLLVGGDDVQYRLIDLPPAPKEDLPDMVRFQSVREFAAADEDSPLDFIPLRGDESTPHHVLAARLRATMVDRARELSEQLDLELARIVPRGISLAAACKRLMPELATGRHLIAAPVGNQLEMVLLRDGEVILLRRARVSGDSASDAAVLGELRRTVAAATGQLEGPVDTAVLIGNDSSLATSQSQSSSWGKVVSLDLNKLLKDWGVSASNAAEAARLAPVLEAALMEADRTAPALDFANPRQRVITETPKRTRILAGVAAATLLAAVGYYLFSELWQLNRETDQLKQQTADQRKALEQFQPFVERANSLEQWMTTDITWLDEIDRAALALRPKTLDDDDYPAGEDVLVKSIQTRRPDNFALGGGVLEIDTLAKDTDALGQVESRLRDKLHEVRTGIIVNEQGGEYQRSMKYDVLVNLPDPSAPEAKQ